MKISNMLKRIMILFVLFIGLMEVYTIVWYREGFFLPRVIKNGYVFTEYFLLTFVTLLLYGVLSTRFDHYVYRILRESWDEFKEIWRHIAEPLKDVRYVVVLLVLFLSIFGYEIFNFTLSLDEEIHMAAIDENAAWCNEGRFSITVLKDILMEFGMYQPCLSNLLGSVILLLAGLCIFTLITDKLTHHRPSQSLSLVFLSGFLSFPSVIAESQSISTYCIEISGGMLGVALAVVYLDRYFVTGKRRNLVWNIFLVFFAIGIYQSLAGMYVSVVIMYFLVLIFNEEEISNQKAVVYLRKILLSAVCFVSGVILFYVVYKIATSIHRVESSIEYINDFSGWNLEYGIFACLLRSIQALISTLSQIQIPGIKYFTYYMILGVLLTIFFLVVYPNLKGALCAGLTLLLTLSGYFIWIALAATSLPFRAWLASPIVCGFLYFLCAYIIQIKFRRKYGIICQLIIVIILFRQVQTVNELFYNDHVRMEKDVTFARELYHDICYEVGRPTSETPIVFIGTVDLGADDAIIKNPYAEKYWGGNCQGYSFWRRAQEPVRMRRLYDVLGYTLNIYNCDDQNLIEYARSNMTVYPQKDSITWIDGVIYVRLE